MSAPSGPSEEALAAADELFEEFRLGSDSDIEPAAAIISKHLPVGELRECLREAAGALAVVAHALYEDKGSYIPARKWLRDHGRYEDNLEGESVLIDVAETA